MKKTNPKKPQTEAEWCAYRCQLSCKIGRDVLEGIAKTPHGVTPLEYAVFNLLHAVEELSKTNDLTSSKGVLELMVERGAKAWKDVPDASAWVEELRGNDAP